MFHMTLTCSHGSTLTENGPPCPKGCSLVAAEVIGKLVPVERQRPKLRLIQGGA